MSISLDDRLSVGEIIIELPLSWQPHERQEIAAIFERSEVFEYYLPKPTYMPLTLVNKMLNPTSVSFTEKDSPCGIGTHGIELPTQNVSGYEDLISKHLVREWAKYRWGVFDEISLEDKFNNRQGVPETVMCPKYCQNCTNIPQETSIMFDPVVGQRFCTKDTHYADAPTIQNDYCLGDSVMDVILRHSDFSMASGVDPAVSTLFQVVTRTRRKVVIAFEETAKELSLIKMLISNYIFHTKNAEIGIISFGKRIKEVLPMQSKEEIEPMMGAEFQFLFTKTKSSGAPKIEIENVVWKAVKMLGSTCGEIVIIGEQTYYTPPDSPTIKDEVQKDIPQNGCIVHRITIGKGLIQESWFSALIENVGGIDFVTLPSNDNIQTPPMAQIAHLFANHNIPTSTIHHITTFRSTVKEMQLSIQMYPNKAVMIVFQIKNIVNSKPVTALAMERYVDQKKFQILNSNTFEDLKFDDSLITMSHHDSHAYLVIRNSFVNPTSITFDFKPFLDYMRFNVNDPMEVFLMMASEYTAYHPNIKTTITSMSTGQMYFNIKSNMVPKPVVKVRMLAVTSMDIGILEKVEYIKSNDSVYSALIDPLKCPDIYNYNNKKQCLGKVIIEVVVTNSVDYLIHLHTLKMQITGSDCQPEDLEIELHCWKISDTVDASCKLPDEENIAQLNKTIPLLKSNSNFNMRKPIFVRFDPLKESFGKCRHYLPLTGSIVDAPCDGDFTRYCLQYLDVFPPTTPRQFRITSTQNNTLMFNWNESDDQDEERNVTYEVHHLPYKTDTNSTRIFSSKLPSYQMSKLSGSCPPFLPINLEVNLLNLGANVRDSVLDKFKLLAVNYLNSSLKNGTDESDFRIIHSNSQFNQHQDHFRTNYKLIVWNGNQSALKCKNTQHIQSLTRPFRYNRDNHGHRRH